MRAQASGHYDRAACMTDKLAALGILSGVEGEQSAEEARDGALKRFYDDAEGDALVVNKWFGLQSTSGKADVLADVKKLTEHPDFSLNPNRVRALIGGFTANLAAFHREDGLGYAFVADWVKELDAKNPQLASRIVGCLINFKRYDEGRGKLMRSQLEGIRDLDGLSPDTGEVVGRALR